MKGDLKFPEGFLWGASTSAHQVEGGNHNDWTDWEESPKRLKMLKQSGELKKYGKANFISAAAADHYNRYEDDFALAKKLHHNTTRISIEWSRIMPSKGQVDRTQLEHYKKVIAAIKNQGMEPMVTLWHYTNPAWLAEQSWWLSRKTADDFVDYCKVVLEELASEVRYWMLFNEPEMYCYFGYFKGVWSPGIAHRSQMLKAGKHIVDAHKRAYVELKAQWPTTEIGTVANVICLNRDSDTLQAKMAYKYTNSWRNHYYIKHVQDCIDFIGVNYYFHSAIAADGSILNNLEDTKSDLGWGLYPEGLKTALAEMGKYKKPLYVTESGLADAADSRRAWYGIQCIRAAHQAIEEGMDVRGFLHWSLLDNFEWAEGFWPRFGLIEVDYKNQERTIRSSAKVFAKIAQSNSLPEKLLQQYNSPPAVDSGGPHKA